MHIRLRRNKHNYIISDISAEQSAFSVNFPRPLIEFAMESSQNGVPPPPPPTEMPKSIQAQLVHVACGHSSWTDATLRDQLPRLQQVLSDMHMSKPNSRRMFGGDYVFSAYKQMVGEGQELHCVAAAKTTKTAKMESPVYLVYRRTNWVCQPPHIDLPQLLAALLDGKDTAENLVHSYQTGKLSFKLELVKDLVADVRADVHLPDPVPMALPLILPTTDGQFAVDQQGLHVLTSQLSEQIVVPQMLVGAMREGKSTLNNFTARHMLASKRPLRTPLFGTSEGVRSCTRGIHVYALPLKLLFPSAPEGSWLLLADCEGFGENKGNQEAGLYDTQLFAMAALTCQSLLFNTKEKLDASMLDRVATWKQAISSLDVSREPKPDLVLVLRDFNLARDDAKQYYQDCMCQGGGNTAQTVLQKLFASTNLCLFSPPCSSLSGEISSIPWWRLSSQFKHDFDTQFLPLLQQKAKEAVHPSRSWKGADYARRLQEA